ncbi:RNA polymerase sigma factor [Luteolibacter soli]|uniref:RNA polymerase sigma factor n=1 Tax=Luteolibacter soli TaxID=3135280 RepID=A0ABU9ATE1_9BACT
MEKSAPSDHDLLAQWLGEHREAAFHALVDRYTALVHATARRTCGDESIATEASQLTFITLAGKAASLLSCASLGGWLHATSMMHAKNLIRKSQRENRKRHHLQLAMETTPPDATSQSVWKDMEPMLDDALAALPAKDREALLLRFYRSLSIREIAATLGIATAAAQKRVDRAVERLRLHLSRRGCQAGGTLSAAMLAGFAVDAQAALPASSVLASKALAASAATGSLATLATFLTATVMKTTSFVPPLAVLLAAVTWIGSQRHSLASVESESTRLRQQLADQTLASTNPGAGTRKLSAERAMPTDWKELAALLDDPVIRRQFWQRVENMTSEELVRSLREISTLSMLQSERVALENVISGKLVAVDPEAALVNFPDQLGDPGMLGRQLPVALLAWMRKEPAEAIAWLDTQIAAGRLDSKRLGHSDGTRTAFEANAVVGLLSSDPAAAGRRLANLTDEDRAETMRYAGTLGIIDPPEAFVALARQQLPDEGAKEAIKAQAAKRVHDTDFSSVNEFLDAVAATPAERENCVRSVVPDGTMAILMQRKIAAEDIRAIRDWAISQSPALAGEATGNMLGQISIQQDQIPYPEIISLVRQYHEAGDGDSLLISFLENTYAENEANKVMCRELAEKVTDEAKRSELLQNLK